MAEHLLNEGHIEQAEIEAARKEVQAEVEDSVQFALQSAEPSMEDAWRHLNCNRHHEVLI